MRLIKQCSTSTSSSHFTWILKRDLDGTSLGMSLAYNYGKPIGLARTMCSLPAPIFSVDFTK